MNGRGNGSSGRISGRGRKRGNFKRNPRRENTDAGEKREDNTGDKKVTFCLKGRNEVEGGEEIIRD